MLGFVGCGNMAQAMLKGILAKGLYKADGIIVSRRTKEALDALQDVYKRQVLGLRTVEKRGILLEDLIHYNNE